MATKHFVIDPTGKKHTRTSQNRVYSHCVLTRRSETASLARATGADHARSDRNNFDYYIALVNGTHKHCKSLYSSDDPVKRIEDAKVSLNGATTFEAYSTAQQIARVEDILQRKSAGYFTAFEVAGWCGRRDLAEKLAATLRAKGRHDEVIIAEAQIDAPRAAKTYEDVCVDLGRHDLLES